MLVFSALFGVLLYLILRTQGLHPLNPRDLGSRHLGRVVQHDRVVRDATRTGSSTRGETTLSYFSQMAGLAVQNFVSAGVGIAVLVAFIRGARLALGQGDRRLLRRLHARGPLRLLPLSVIVGLVLVSQGVLQTLSGTVDATGLTGLTQIRHGPVACQEAIKMLGTNGGGFFNVNSAMPYENPTWLELNSAMPFENPTWLSNFVEMLAILAHPGRADRDVRPHGRQPPPGLDGLRRDDDAVRRRGRGHLRQRVRPDAGDARRRA